MKILQLTYSLSSGGGERLLVDLSNRLAANPNNEVVVITILSDKNPHNTHYKKDLSSKIKYINLDCEGGLKPQSLFKVYNVIKDENPDIVHAHCNVMALYVPALLYRRTKYVHTLHSLATFCVTEKWQPIVNKFFYKKYIQAVTISNECTQSFNSLYNLSNSIQVTNGREPQIVTPKYKTIKEEVDRYKKKDTTPVFIHIARNHPVKNQKLLFDTFNWLKQNNIDALLLVLGAGHDENKIIYKENSQIVFVGETTNVSDYLAASDFFIMSSILEGLPLSLLESMSLGLVPISTPAGGVQDVVKNGINGYISKDHSLEEFYKTVLKAIEERGKYPAAKIVEEYESKYSMTICADRYNQVYNKLLSNEN